jgi:putative transposase
MATGLQEICRLFGYSRQAYYKHEKKGASLAMQQAIVLKLVEDIRSKMPRIGVIKLYHMLRAPMSSHGIKMGRDKLFDLLNYFGMLIRKKRRRNPITTDSNHPFYKYKNLIKNLRIDHADMVWVSDITYIRLLNGFCYLSLVTDAYSRKIVGYFLNKDLGSAGTINALRMALGGYKRKKGVVLIHHSDRGLQYCCSEYISILAEHHIAISMTQNGDPYENAIAERVNGILKDEFTLGNTFRTIQDAQSILENAVKSYNEHRPHLSLKLLTPQQVYQTI